MLRIAFLVQPRSLLFQMSRRASSRNTKKNEPEPEPVAVSASKRRRGAETTTAASTQGDEEDTQPKKRSTSNASVAKEQPASTSTNVKAVKSRKPSADVGETADTKTKKGKSDKPPSTAGAPPISIAKDSKIRCVWATKHPLELEYHDSEWGAWPMPAKGYSDKKYFEFLILESAQAGLSWLTILKKREAYKTAFADFDFDAVAKFTAKDVERLLKSDGGSPELTIVRNKAKIEATIEAAKLFRSSILKEWVTRRFVGSWN